MTLKTNHTSGESLHKDIINFSFQTIMSLQMMQSASSIKKNVKNACVKFHSRIGVCSYVISVCFADA